MNGLLLAGGGAWVLDLVFCLLLVLGVFVGVWRGFVASVIKIAGIILAVFVGVTFCIALQNALEGWFGLTSKLADLFGGHSWSGTLAYWLMNIACFLVLGLLTWLFCFFVGRLGKKLVSAFGPVRIIDRALGGILGLFQAGILILLLLAICYWISTAFPAMRTFIDASTIVGKIFNWSWFQDAVRLKFTKG